MSSLSIRAIRKMFGKAEILKGIDLTVPAGQALAQSPRLPR